MALIKMIQVSKARWRIESSDGNVILDDIILGNQRDAIDFIEAYISTWQHWEYVLVLLEDKK